ncbi:MAG: cytochrome c oxidase subunit 2 [Candidatus Poribacteria bacterium]|nr:MAG: cytochrome c oxidase subunit 2 [Candidatus Poribacteria bacterium]
MQEFPILPERASTIAGEVDALFWGLVAFSVIAASAVIGIVLYLAIKYRAGSAADRSGRVEGNFKMELAWIATAVVLGIAVFTAGAKVYFDTVYAPADALHVYVVGKQWMWKIEHPEGPREINELHVPVGRPVRLTITSQDVIHSFYVPEFRIKMDAVPGRYTQAWFQATQPGVYHLFCAEYCGTEHSRMIGRVVAMTPADYEAWLESQKAGAVVASAATAGGTMASRGEQLFVGLGCASCHVQGPQARGPSLVGLMGTEVTLADGSTVVADEAYIRESILNPAAKIVAGWTPVMPSFQGLVSEEDIFQLIQYIQSLSRPGGASQ